MLSGLLRFTLRYNVNILFLYFFFIFNHTKPISERRSAGGGETPENRFCKNIFTLKSNFHVTMFKRVYTLQCYSKLTIFCINRFYKYITSRFRIIQIIYFMYFHVDFVRLILCE